MKREIELVVHNRQGIHLNSASRIARIAGQFEAEISVLRLDPVPADHAVNAKDIADLLQLTAGPGARLRLVADGSDAPAALDALARLFAEGFGEPGS